MSSDLLRDLVLSFGVGVLAVLALAPLRVPALVAYMLAGVLVGPHGVGLVHDAEAVHVLAEVGVVVLLFTIGVEMSLARVLRLGAGILLAGAVQIFLATAGAAGPLLGLGASARTAVVLGLLVAPSSTTLVLRVLGAKGELDAPQGRLAIGVCLLQDLAIVPVMILLPTLAGASRGVGDVAWAVGRSLVLVGGTVALARLVVPRLLHAAVRSRSRELFALATILVCLGTAFAAQSAGVSLALGAFLGGLVVSESAYGQQVLGQMGPLRDGLSGLFFLGMGMLLDVSRAFADAGAVLGGAAAIVVLKTLTTGTGVLVAGYGWRVAALASVALAQVGEFSFVLVREANARLGLIDDLTAQRFLGASVLTMLATPLLYQFAPRLAAWLGPLGRGRVRRTLVEDEPPAPRDGHVVVAGYGLTGRHVARALGDHGIPWVALELNPDTVHTERRRGAPVVYGDAGFPEVLEGVGLAHARILVVATGDAAGTPRIVSAARQVSATVRVLARVRTVAEAPALRALGASDVVPEELETSVEVLARVLKAYDLPSAAIERSVSAVRADAYDAVRSSAGRAGLTTEQAREMAHLDLETHVVSPGSAADGRTIGELAVRAEHGVTVAGVRRSGEVLPSPDAGTRLCAADVVVLLGTPERLARAAALFAGRQDAVGGASEVT